MSTNTEREALADELKNAIIEEHGCTRREWIEKIDRLAAQKPEQAATTQQTEPVAWRYELAHAVCAGVYSNWQWHIGATGPCVPEGSIRNLTPLYAAPKVVELLTDEQIVDALSDAGLNLAFRSYEHDIECARAIENHLAAQWGVTLKKETP